MTKIISKCPCCGEKLKIAALECSSCGMELRNDFDISSFDCLSNEQYNFLITFLKCRGNLSELQAKLQIPYATAKMKLSELIAALGIADETKKIEEVPNMENWTINEMSKNASEIIKAKLVKNNGRATVYTLTGNPCNVWVVDKDKFTTDKFKNNNDYVNYEYHIFDIIVSLIISQGGKAVKGSGRSRLGEPGCEETTVAGAIIKNYFGKDIGGSGYDPGFVLIAILEWAGIVKNGRKFAELTPEYMDKIGFYG